VVISTLFTSRCCLGFEVFISHVYKGIVAIVVFALLAI
jgi:hypothetical protein